METGGEILARVVCQQKMIKKLLFLENVNLAKEYLEGILGIEVDEDEEMDVGN